jgi:hypothetical protein
VTLSWQTQYADRLQIDPIGVDVSKVQSLNVSVSSTTTYTLTAKNTIGSMAAAVTVTAVPVGTPQLSYTDPPSGGKIRLIKDAASNGSLLVLKLVSNAALTGYSVGFNIPLAPGKVQLDGPGIVVSNEALNAGSAPQAVGATIPASGPMTNILATGMSQKAAGAGAAPNDASITSGKTFYIVRLSMAPGATAGVVFNGSSLGNTFRASLRDKVGNETVSQGDFAIGTLSIVQ